MAVRILDIEKKSPCAGKRIRAGDTLLRINAHEIMDVLDYRFYMQAEKLNLEIRTENGHELLCAGCGECEQCAAGRDYPCRFRFAGFACRRGITAAD